MWIFQFKFSSIFIARYIKYFVCLLFISNIFLKYWVIHLSYWNEKQSIYIRNRYSQRKYQKKLFSKGSSTCTYVQRWREGRGQAKCIQLHTMGREGVQGWACTHKKILDYKISKLSFFCTKETITLPFIIVYRKV